MVKIQSDNGSGAIEQAKQTFYQAKEQAKKLNMLPLLAHCSMALGEHYMKMKENEKARAEILEANQLYGSLNMGFWQPKAKALLIEVS